MGTPKLPGLLKQIFCHCSRARGRSQAKSGEHSIEIGDHEICIPMIDKMNICTVNVYLYIYIHIYIYANGLIGGRLLEVFQTNYWPFRWDHLSCFHTNEQLHRRMPSQKSRHDFSAFHPPRTIVMVISQRS